MKPLCIALLFCSIAYAGFAQSNPVVPAKPATKTEFPKASQYNNSKLSYKIISSANGTWGYDIYADGRKMIHQPSVPGMPGNEGFKTKVRAEKVAGLVITKIRKGEMPPTVEIKEMKKLKAI